MGHRPGWVNRAVCGSALRSNLFSLQSGEWASLLSTQLETFREEPGISLQPIFSLLNELAAKQKNIFCSMCFFFRDKQDKVSSPFFLMHVSRVYYFMLYSSAVSSNHMWVTALSYCLRQHHSLKDFIYLFLEREKGGRETSV